MFRLYSVKKDFCSRAPDAYKIGVKCSGSGSGTGSGCYMYIIFTEGFKKINNKEWKYM